MERVFLSLNATNIFTLAIMAVLIWAMLGLVVTAWKNFSGRGMAQG
jgi:hypothetical protein